MRSFSCDHCHHLVFFENSQCLHCGAQLAFVPERMAVTALQPHPWLENCWDPLSPTVRETYPSLRMCANHAQYGSACNFTTESDGSQPYCVSCRQTRWLPDLSDPRNLPRWIKIENAKRYLFYTLSRLQLTTLQGVQPPIFDFLQDLPGQAPVMTGHASGTITLNVAEADDDERARVRLALHEPYRTLLGHLRHESGHFFWDILIRGTPWQDAFRILFGDESRDYGDALRLHYENPLPLNWHVQFVSAYATAHPWEDWAETWAHYLHVMDLLETAASYQVSLQLPGQAHPIAALQDPFASHDQDFVHILQQCMPVTLMLNSLNRSLGQNDAYPFALSNGAIEKLGFVHRVVNAHRQRWQAALGASTPLAAPTSLGGAAAP